MRKITLAAAVVMLAAPLAAQTSPQVTNDLTVTMTPQQYRICSDRPARPTWMDEVHPREAYKANTVMELYEIRAWQTIAASGDCGCDVRFPAWDTSNNEYQQGYSGLTQAEHSALRRELIENRKQLEPTVREICEAPGNW
ncbi:hypothetical protein [Tabrizicola sp.]|uniref:hypothetical protein n=1 Tax=Tabrizicola sp. TaxID=2005166 RepID=UPI002734EE59|nr:hypothetical protein [Tabrizicola sp.]MDP3197185.1 hypothetical protein [Tabrizicola sp.]